MSVGRAARTARVAASAAVEAAWHLIGHAPTMRTPVKDPVKGPVKDPVKDPVKGPVKGPVKDARSRSRAIKKRARALRGSPRVKGGRAEIDLLEYVRKPYAAEQQWAEQRALRVEDLRSQINEMRILEAAKALTAKRRHAAELEVMMKELPVNGSHLREEDDEPHMPE